MAGQLSELERLQIQSRVWEPAGRALLERIGLRPLRAIDIGCGALGWLRVLSQWLGDRGTVLGTDVDERLLAAARTFAETERLTNVEVARDDLFDSQLPAGSFDLVHARFQIAPLGRGEEQVASYRRLVAPGGVIVLEDPDTSSWRFHPESKAVQRLTALIKEAFRTAGGDLDAGVREVDLLRGLGAQPEVRAHIEALPPGHGYLRLPLQFATSLRPRLVQLISPAELDELVAEAERDLQRPGVWGTTFTLIQSWATFA
jgi:SAM-dependent methyltransferase